MGFWYKEDSAPKTTGTRKQIMLVENKRQLGCKNCTLDKAILTSPKMEPTGSDSPWIYLLGPHPSSSDDEQGEQFSDAAGDYIRNKIPSSYLKRTRFNNVVRCKTPPAKDPTQLELECCRNLQEEDIARTKPKIVLGFGYPPLKWATGMGSYMDWRGRRVPMRVKDHSFWFFPMLDLEYLQKLRHDKKKGEEWERVFRRDLDAALALLDDWEEPVVEYPADVFNDIHLITSYNINDVIDALDRVSKSDHGLDIETKGTKPYAKDAKILTLAVGAYGDTIVFPVRHRESKWTPAQLKDLDEVVKQYLLNSGRKWCHNAVFEQEWLSYFYGEEILFESEWGDTMAQAHVLDERSGKGLDDLTIINFGFNIKTLSKLDRNNLDDEPLPDVMRYNGGDAKYTDALAAVQNDRLERVNLTHVYHKMHAHCRSMVRTQAKGLEPNFPLIDELDKKLTTETTALKGKIIGLKEVRAWSQKNQKQFNPTSTEDLKSLLFDLDYREEMEKGGKYSTDEEVLERINHPIAKLELELRGKTKLHGTYILPYRKNGGARIYLDGKIHGNFNHLKTVTTRLSSDDPNLQNFPKRKDRYIRNIIRCPDGYWIVAIDYGQIEARVIAMATRPRKFVEQLWSDFDIHMHWTNRALDLQPEWYEYVAEQVGIDTADEKAVRKACRNDIKNGFVFAKFYGSMDESVAANLHLDVDVARELGNEFWSDYKEAKEWQQRTRSNYIKNGYCETLQGWRRRAPLSLNELMNTPIQGTAAGIVLDAMDELTLASYELGRPQYQPVLNVHDDLTFYIPNKTLERDIEFIAQTMVNRRYSFMNVPLLAEVSVGSTWGDLEEVAVYNSKNNKEWMDWYETHQAA